VPTGEGKSVVLAVSAATLALYGYYVDCVCYSDNLSSRDESAFKRLFEQLGSKNGEKVADMIRCIRETPPLRHRFHLLEPRSLCAAGTAPLKTSASV
jgi:preprotein translocase subunit SecA